MGRKQQPAPVFLLGKFHGQSLVSYSPQGCKDLDMTEYIDTHTHTHTTSEMSNILRERSG